MCIEGIRSVQLAGPRGFEPRISGFLPPSGGLRTDPAEQFGALILSGLRALSIKRRVSQAEVLVSRLNKLLAYPPSLPFT